MPNIIVDPGKIGMLKRVENDRENNLLYERLSCSPVTNIASQAKHPVPPGYRLIRADNRANKFEIALLDDHTKAVVYYNEVFCLDWWNIENKPATQSFVWRSTHFSYKNIVRDLASNVFFNYILENHVVMLSDREQSYSGRDFWLRQLSAALGMGFYTYHCEDQELKASLTLIPDQSTLNNLVNDIWGVSDTDHFHNQLALISKKQLPAQITKKP